MVVDYGRKPRAGRLASFIDDEQVEHGVIGLPDRIGGACAVPVNELVAVAEGGGALMRQRHDCRIEIGEDRIDRDCTKERASRAFWRFC